MPYDPRSANAARLKMFHLIAEKIQRDPRCLQTGLDNIARWIANGSTQQDKLRAWERMILAAQESAEGMEALQNALREDSERAEFFRNFAPFAGVLTNTERRPLILECSFSH
ncbi:MAG: hypothetical protein WCG66_04700 [bacterium]